MVNGSFPTKALSKSDYDMLLVPGDDTALVAGQDQILASSRGVCTR
jgi:hypothetical protein